MSYDALRQGRHSLHHQIYCITPVTCDCHALFTVITAARLLVRDIGDYPLGLCLDDRSRCNATGRTNSTLQFC